MNWNKIKGYVISVIIGIILAGLASSISFYFMTKNTLAQHSKQINGNTKNVKDLDNTIKNNEQAPIVIQGEIKVIKKEIEYIRETQQDQKVQLGKIYDLLIDLKAHNNN